MSEVDRVLREVARGLVPGGRFFYDTINRNPISRLTVINMAEDVFRVLPRGTHDPVMFMTPRELAAGLRRACLQPGETALGPRGLDRNLDPTFGPIPFTSIIYMGYAERT